MGISINTNVAASRAGMYLGTNHANLQKSLDRLSSGKRITEPADDAGGLAVSMKLEHTSKVLQGVSRNIANATSLLQVQDGVLKSAGDIISRIGELKSMYDDVTKNTSDKNTYEAELVDLQGQIEDLAATSFNGIGLFDQTLVAATDLRVFLDETSTDAVSMDWTNHDLLGHADLITVTVAATAAGFDTGEITQAEITTALERIATMRATNGGEVRRLQYAQANTNTQVVNIDAANGRIMDVDIAAESSNLAKQQVLVQASAAMTAQSNVANDVALMLLQ
jgi:flagellin